MPKTLDKKQSQGILEKGIEEICTIARIYPYQNNIESIFDCDIDAGILDPEGLKSPSGIPAIMYLRHSMRPALVRT